MSVVFAVLQIVLAIMLFESLRILTKIPNSGRLLRSAFGCSTAIVIFMALCVGGVGYLLRYFTIENPRPPVEPLHWLAIAAIVLAGGVYLVLLYRKRRRARAAIRPDAADVPQPKRAA